jgi:hypothetical protein
MATIKTHAGTKTALTSASLATLASATYCVSSAYNASTNDPIDLVIEAVIGTTNAPTGNKQAVIFAQASYDNGTTWQSGPTSGTTTTDEPDLTFLGTVPVSAAGTHVKSFSVAAAYGGIVPPMVRIVVKNDLGVALTTGTLATIEYSGSVA